MNKMNPTKKFTSAITLAILWLLLPAGTLRGQEIPALQDLSSYIEESRQLFGVPGLAVGIIKDGKVVMNRGFGLRHAGQEAQVDSLTVFGIASCSKAFTAAAMAMLADDSLLQWNDRVTEHLPWFQLSDTCTTREMRVEDLLSHRSGLQTFDGDLLWYGTGYSREEVVKRIRYREPSYSFRNQYGYQNVMFIAAGEVLEEVTGDSWDQFLADRIFNPLGMASSTTSNGHFTPAMNLAYPHIDGKPLEFLDYDNCGPAASINTCSSDLLRWVKMWLGKGSRNGTTLFSESQYYKMTAPHTLMNSGRGEEVGGTHFRTYGLGWFMFDYKGRKVIQHGGGLPGFHSKVVLVPEDSLGVVILANQLSGLVEALYQKILNHYLEGPDTDWARLYYDYQKKGEARNQAREEERNATRARDTSPSHDLYAFTGTYEDTMYGKAMVVLEDGRLHLTLLPTAGLFSGALEHWENDTFQVTLADPFLPPGFVSFHSDEDNRVKRFTIDLENPDFHFYKLDFMKIE